MPQTPPRICVGQIVIAIVMIVLLFAGLAKAWNVTDFATSLRGWWLIPHAMRPILVLLIPSLEIGLSTAWLMNVIRPIVLPASVALLAAFTFVYVAHAFGGQVPRCACLGLRQLATTAQIEMRIVVARNVVMIAALMFGWFTTKGTKNNVQVHGSILPSVGC